MSTAPLAKRSPSPAATPSRWKSLPILGPSPRRVAWPVPSLKPSPEPSPSPVRTASLSPTPSELAAAAGGDSSSASESDGSKSHGEFAGDLDKLVAPLEELYNTPHDVRISSPPVGTYPSRAAAYDATNKFAKGHGYELVTGQKQYKQHGGGV
jgi:hypothetical protein